ncbi:MAG: metallopeptidase family protein [Acidobacteriales bacterium]|nr:metallopeptidase family protein [Terriglobales bacterium]
MKLMAMVILAGLAAGQVWAADGNKGGKEIVTAYIWGEENVPFDVRSRALQTASDVFAEIGVSVKWRHKRPAEGQAQREGAVAICIAGKTGGSSQQTLAAARPYEGSAITIFYGAMGWASQQPQLARMVFAHVLVHEITHNLQQVSQHSRTGMMKERWTKEDFAAMQWKPLSFEPADVELIHKGLARRAEQVAANNTALVSSTTR